MVTIPDGSWQRPTSNFTISLWARAKSWTHTESSQDYFIFAKQQFYADDWPNFFYNIHITYSGKYVG
jgi:hypothetical protein